MKDNTPYLLVADDHEDTREMVAFGVRQRGWLCDTAASPQELIRLVREQALPDDPTVTRYDAIICDVNYQNQDEGEPYKTGVSAIRELRVQFRNLAVIFITGHTTKRLRDEALSVSQELVVKPFDVNYVLDRVVAWMSWMKPNEFKGRERRRFGINRSGYHRRTSDNNAPLIIRPDIDNITHTLSRK
jgi:CheY-like chemotaxis protein